MSQSDSSMNTKTADTILPVSCLTTSSKKGNIINLKGDKSTLTKQPQSKQSLVFSPSISGAFINLSKEMIPVLSRKQVRELKVSLKIRGKELKVLRLLLKTPLAKKSKAKKTLQN